MERRKIFFVGVVTCALAGTSQAGLVATPDPGGYTTYQSMLGTDEITAGTQWSFDEPEGIAFTSSRRAPITYSAFLPEKPLAAGGGADDWRVGVTAIEMTGIVLPASYSEFLLDVMVDGVSVGVLSVPASGTLEHTAFIDIGAQLGTVDVALSWLNPGDPFSLGRPVLGIGVVQFSASEVPTPGTLVLGSLGFIALARRTRAAC